MTQTTAGGMVDPAAILEEGRRAFAAGDFARSEEMLSIALAGGANERDCRIHLARIFNRSQQWSRALEHWMWLRDAQPNVLEPQLQVARALFRLERFPEAAAAFRRVVEIEADHDEAVERLVHISGLPKERLAAAQDQPSEPLAESAPPVMVVLDDALSAAAATQTVSTPVSPDTSSADTLLEEGKAAFRAQQFALSQKLLIDALSAGADEETCRLHLARIYNLSSEWGLALEHWQWLSERAPTAVEPKLQLGRALLRLKRRDEARSAFEAVLALRPDHAEAQRRLEELQEAAGLRVAVRASREDEEPVPALQPSATLPDDGLGIAAGPRRGVDPAPDLDAPAEGLPAEEPAATAATTVAKAILADAREAFRRQDHAHAESLFLRALDAGADEPACRSHLARIYNHFADWLKALDQWRWLQGRSPHLLEPHLQVARALHRLGRLSDAAAAFRGVLALEPSHAEAAETLRRIEAILREEQADAGEHASWLSLPAEALRWRLAGDVLGGAAGSLEAAIGRACSDADALGRAIAAVSEATGSLGSHRQLYGIQASARMAELTALLKDANALVRDLSRRTEKLFSSLERSSGHPATPLRSTAAVLPRSMVRRKTEELVASVRAERGVDAALATLYREGPVEDRPTLLSSFSAALRNGDLASAVRMSWLAYGADPTPAAARRAVAGMFQAGDLSSASTLAATLSGQAPGGSPSAFRRAMESTLVLFKEGVSIPPRIERKGRAEPGTLGYVVSGTLPFQNAGYTVRTQALLDSLQATGIRSICFAQPGFPWDRPHLLAPGQDVPMATTVGRVSYRHTPWPERGTHRTAIDTAADRLSELFHEHAIETVQAASNSLNALPALMAARAIGAKFVYEVRGMWELTAAARLPGWEQTERYRFDRELDIRIATEADHVLAITQGIADELIAGGVPADRISLLPNAVDPDLFAPVPRDGALAESLGLEDGDFVVVYAGSLSSYEGLDDLIEALALLRGQDVAARLVLVGDGEFRADLEALAQARGQAGAVHFVARVGPEEVRRYLSLADAVAIPRKPHRVCQIVSPLKPFEAMAMEKPVILTDLQALREIVDHGRTGLICRPADPADLAAKLLELARSPALRRDLGSAARRWVVDERSWERNARTLGALYARLNGRQGEGEEGSERHRSVEAGRVG